MTTNDLQRYPETDRVSLSSRSVFPVGWILFGTLMVGALSFCYLIEENQVPVLGLTACS